MKENQHVADNAIFSICTPNYIGQAAAFFSSFISASAENSQNVDKYLFVVGASFDPPITESLNARVIRVETVVEATKLQKIAARYTPAELCWALKPLIFKYLLQVHSSALYFDTDIWFTGKVSGIFGELGSADILLTPHYLEPFGCKTSFGVKALSLLRGGVFNAGFLGVQGNSRGISFLDWWADHVAVHGRNDPDNGMCGDQRWLDLVPALYSGCKISRHPGMNIGYWNLHERHIHQEDGELKANGEELIFMHFSGFDFKRPETFSRHLPSFEATDPLLSIIRSYQVAQEKFETLNSSIYIYRKWWHGKVGLYRKIKDAYSNPRECTCL
ncbi:hypothetical protein ACN8ZM_03785 [Burkholderia aenigmatica]|uniref:hypothetical protein n=1 Tax=Burkholderia aenigmatica TaxID=2015348 RepID=UPI003B42B9EA